MSNIDLRIELHNDGSVDVYSDNDYPFAAGELTQGEALACVSAVLLGVRRAPFGNSNERPLRARLGGVHSSIVCRSHTDQDWGHSDNWLKVTSGAYERDGLTFDEALYIIARFIFSTVPGSILLLKRQQPLLEVNGK